MKNTVIGLVTMTINPRASIHSIMPAIPEARPSGKFTVVKMCCASAIISRSALRSFLAMRSK